MDQSSKTEQLPRVMIDPSSVFAAP
uniref:Uncharacterized protein n=1 Tax=Rhizophora mucronata TaxID=61149 RepID=A0A2P2QVT0_RHIMU